MNRCLRVGCCCGNWLGRCGQELLDSVEAVVHPAPGAYNHHVTPVLTSETRMLVAQIRSPTGRIAELEALIGKEGQKLDGHQNLISIKGIGPVGATVLLSAIGDIGDFSDPGKLAAYLGCLVPNSNETEHSGRITKQDNKPAHNAGAMRSHRQRLHQRTCSSSINASSAARAAAKLTSPSPASSWESSIKQMGVRRLPQLRPRLLKQAQLKHE